MAERRSPLLLVTQGDPAGIGPEITLKAWLQRWDRALPPFAVLADPAHLARVASTFGWSVPIEKCEPGEAVAAFPLALPVIPLSRTVDCEPGHPDPRHGESVLESIETAVRLVIDGRADALVTNPISKRVLYEGGFPHPGHTEYLAALATPGSVPPPRSVMMLWSEALCVVPVTVHLALADVSAALTGEVIVETGRIVARDLRDRFKISKPRLAFAGLNPHAGESGAMGREEADIIAPAIALLRAEGIDASGPFPADTMFHERARARYDVALAMYHDQALIPIKTIAFDDAVNVTLGLPFVRTSPDHGTAFDIAGKGVAHPDSLAAAILLAARLTRAT